MSCLKLSRRLSSLDVIAALWRSLSPLRNPQLQTMMRFLMGGKARNTVYV